MSYKGAETNTEKPTEQYYDTNTLYIDSGVATEPQVADSLVKAINDAEEILGKKLKELAISKSKNKNRLKNKKPTEFIKQKCMYKINLLVNKEGAYHGYGYIRVSNPEIYWMLLGRNPDGTERIEEIPDPDWVAPKSPKTKSFEETLNATKSKSWADVAEDEERHIRPMITKMLEPLITLPGFKYDPDQLEHLKELAKENNEDPELVPDMGYFEISRGYAKPPYPGRIKHKIFARNVPNWIPLEAFKIIFSPYVTSKYSKKEYPQVKFINSKNGRLVFIDFDSSTTDGMFALLMTKKCAIQHPKKKNLRCELIFTHAYRK